MEEKSKKNVTKYGEFIPTFHAWLSIDEQKRRAEELEDISEKKEK